MIQEEIKNFIRNTLENLKIEIGDIVLEHPADLSMGDYSTNVAMVLAKNLKTNPKDLAQKITDEINKSLPADVARVEVAGVGFINFYLNQEFFTESIKEIVENKDFGKNVSLGGKKIMVEYTDPNPFKPVHIGHLMTNAIGESLARIFSYAGAIVLRANYQGDVGLHVAKAVYILLQDESSIDKSLPVGKQAHLIGKAYKRGSEAYESAEIKKEIDIINKKIYDKSDERINAIYDWGFKVTMEAFEDLYRMLGTKFDLYFLESEMAPVGEEIVKANLGNIFHESDNAIVFKAEAYDPKLHTRVFLTSTNLPTYETKELGLTDVKFREVKDLDLSIVITANEQSAYMKVVMKALSLIHPEYESRMLHLTHGMMRFASGKMSSRKGNVITGEDLLNEVHEAILAKMNDRDFTEIEKGLVADAVGVAAVKYSILKQNTNSDIIYDFDKSISFEGDSGPYLQYSYARANSVLEKAKKEYITSKFISVPLEVSPVEKLLYRFPEVVLRATNEYAPHHIANYLVELARSYNSYYGNNQIINVADAASSYKVALTEAFASVMKNGLYLLGIEAPNKM